MDTNEHESRRRRCLSVPPFLFSSFVCIRVHSWTDPRVPHAAMVPLITPLTGPGWLRGLTQRART